MRGRWLAILGCLLAAFAVAFTACGDDDDDGGGGGGGTAPGKTLKLYSSWPLQGAAKAQGDAMVNGIKLALKQRGGKVGDFKVTYTPLDDSLASTGAADEGKAAQNARKVVQDRSAIAFIAAYNSGMAKVQIPITSKAGLLQVSPANTYVGLTTDKPGSESGEPDKYYRGDKRNYARVVPIDTVQGAALVKAAQEADCKSAHLFNSKTTYSAGLNRNIALSAKEKGLEITGDDGIDIKAPNYRSLVERVDADCVIASVEAENNGVQLMKDVGTVKPDVKMFEADGFVLATTADPKKGMPANLAPRIKATIATLDIAKSFGDRGKKFVADYKAEFGTDADPYAVYAYECASLILDAIEKLGADGGDRGAVLDEVFNTKNRNSILGTYSIDENGDTTLTDYGLYVIKDGKWVFEKVLKAD